MNARGLRDRIDMLEGNHFPKGNGSVCNPKRFRKPLGGAIAADHFKKGGVTIKSHGRKLDQSITKVNRGLDLSSNERMKGSPYYGRNE